MQDLSSLGSPKMDAIVIDSMTLEQYHSIIYWNLAKFRSFRISASTSVNPGEMFFYRLSNRPEDVIGISVLNPKIYWTDWETVQGMYEEVTEDGWTRY
jgi:hypothetical protein